MAKSGSSISKLSWKNMTLNEAFDHRILLAPGLIFDL